MLINTNNNSPSFGESKIPTGKLAKKLGPNVVEAFTEAAKFIDKKLPNTDVFLKNGIGGTVQVVTRPAAPQKRTFVQKVANLVQSMFGLNEGSTPLVKSNVNSESIKKAALEAEKKRIGNRDYKAVIDKIALKHIPDEPKKESIPSIEIELRSGVRNTKPVKHEENSSKKTA